MDFACEVCISMHPNQELADYWLYRDFANVIAFAIFDKPSKHTKFQSESKITGNSIEA